MHKSVQCAESRDIPKRRFVGATKFECGRHLYSIAWPKSWPIWQTDDRTKRGRQKCASIFRRSNACRSNNHLTAVRIKQGCHTKWPCNGQHTSHVNANQSYQTRTHDNTHTHAYMHAPT